MTKIFLADHPPIVAMQEAMRWLVLRVVLASPDPTTTLQDFVASMRRQADDFIWTGAESPIKQHAVALDIVAEIDRLVDAVTAEMPSAQGS